MVELVRDEAAADAHEEGLEDHEAGDDLPPAAQLLGAEAAPRVGGAEECQGEGDEVGEGEDERELLGVAVGAREGR